MQILLKKKEKMYSLVNRSSYMCIQNSDIFIILKEANWPDRDDVWSDSETLGPNTLGPNTFLISTTRELSSHLKVIADNTGKYVPLEISCK